MKVLVFGRDGQVGRELARRRPDGVEVTLLDREQADLTDPAACADAVRSSEADVVLNAAAWTAVDQAETHEAVATLINGQAPAAMARACAIRALPFLHISSDYVFDGAGQSPFAPDHPPAPLGAYGRSKLAGERGVRDSGARALILRTSWVVSAHGSNFVKTMLRLGRERDRLSVVADQVGGPTPAAALADGLYLAAAAMMNGHPGGAHHLAGAPDTNWADFARAIMTAAALPCRIDGICSADYPTAAQRPLNSRLDCSSFTRAFGMARPDWRRGLNDILAELGAKV